MSARELSWHEKYIIILLLAVVILLCSVTNGWREVKGSIHIERALKTDTCVAAAARRWEVGDRQGAAIQIPAVPNLATSTPETSETTILTPGVVSLGLLLLGSALGKIRLDGGAPITLTPPR